MTSVALRAATLAAQARGKGQDLVLDVLTVNRRAQALYQRLGSCAKPGQPGWWSV